MGYNVNNAVDQIKNIITYIENKNASVSEKEETRMLKEVLAILETKDVIFIEWSVEDVEAIAEKRKVDITRKQAQDILSDIDNDHDATLGITWETIDFYMDEYDVQ